MNLGKVGRGEKVMGNWQSLARLFLSYPGNEGIRTLGSPRLPLLGFIFRDRPEVANSLPSSWEAWEMLKSTYRSPTKLSIGYLDFWALVPVSP